jgi:large subunit ribosomal protein L4
MDGQALIIQGLGTTTPDATPKTKEVARVLNALQRPDIETTESQPEAEQTKAAARRRTLARRSVLIGLPSNDPVFYRSARNLEGVAVLPVAEFNTYDILKQRYLILTPEALAALKERVKSKPERRPALKNA